MSLLVACGTSDVRVRFGASCCEWWTFSHRVPGSKQSTICILDLECGSSMSVGLDGSNVVLACFRVHLLSRSALKVP